MIKSYTEENIKDLTNIEAIRLRPGMYIGNIQNGVLHLLNEIVSNSVDEFIEHRCSTINILVNVDKKEFLVSDDGWGIPLGKLENVSTITHSGGKFDESSYKYSGGLHGVGLTATNALSSNCYISSKRNGDKKTIYFKKGIKQEIFEEKTNENNGTIVCWQPDKEVFKEYINITDNLIKQIDNLLYFKASINNGIVINLNIIKNNMNLLVKKYHFTDGIIGFFERFKIANKIKKIIPDIIVVEDKENNMEVDAVLAFAGNTDDCLTMQFVNGIQNISFDSKHSQGMMEGCLNSLIRNMNNNNLIPKNINITKNNIKEIFCGVILAKHNNPQFTGQTKENFSSHDYFIFIKNATTIAMNNWCNKHYNQLVTLSKTIVQLVKLKNKAKDNKELAISSSKGSLLSTESMNKFTDCTTNNRHLAELFLVEGLSAGGTMSKSCKREFQATYKLRGKVLNVNQKNQHSEELETLVKILGCGIGNKKDISKIRFGKIIIACDADIDGAHIRSLLLGFFFKFYPELIEKGYIYLANPPLYGIKFNKLNKNIFINNENKYNNLLRHIIINEFDLINLKNKKILSKELMNVYLHKIKDYYPILNSFSKMLVIDPILLETIVLNLNSIVNKSNFKSILKIGFLIKELHSNSGKVYEFDRNIEHYTLCINKEFYENVYLPIINELINIYLNDVGFKHKSNNYIFGGNTFTNSYILNNILNSRKGIHISRYKGLGEMNYDDLIETVTEPKTRSIIQVTLNDYQLGLENVQIFLSSKRIDEKKEKLLKK